MPKDVPAGLSYVLQNRKMLDACGLTPAEQIALTCMCERSLDALDALDALEAATRDFFTPELRWVAAALLPQQPQAMPTLMDRYLRRKSSDGRTLTEFLASRGQLRSLLDRSQSTVDPCSGLKALRARMDLGASQYVATSTI